MHEKNVMKKLSILCCSLLLLAGPVVAAHYNADVWGKLSGEAYRLFQQGQFYQAEVFAKDPLAVATSVVGPDGSLAPSSLSLLATIYHRQGRPAPARPFFQKALPIREKIHDSDHPEVINKPEPTVRVLYFPRPVPEVRTAGPAYA
jgi:hypothetical protein